MFVDGLAEIQRACHYYIIHGGCSQEEKERFGHLISEKLYYYEQISSELEEIMMIKAKNAVA